MDHDAYDLILPFLDTDPRFAHGVEIGVLYQRMKREWRIEGQFLTVNQEQITLMANRLGWNIEEMKVVGDDFLLKMTRA